MSRPGNRAGLRQRRVLAESAARRLNEGWDSDPARAISRAAAELGIHQREGWPTPQEVEALRRERHALFAGSDDLANPNERLRQVAAQLERFSAFEPRYLLTAGAELDPMGEPIAIQLVVEPRELLDIQLLDNRRSWHTRERPLRPTARHDRVVIYELRQPRIRPSGKGGDSPRTDWLVELWALSPRQARIGVRDLASGKRIPALNGKEVGQL